MVSLAGWIMIGSAAVCLGGSLRDRRLVSIVAALIMMFAMIDHAALDVLPTLVWTSALAAAGVALGLELRLRSAHDASGLRGTAARVSQLHRVVSTLSALAYLATAWLMLGHAHAGTVNGWDVPAHHGAVQPVDVPLVLTVMLIVALAGLGIVSRRHRQRAMAIEASAMALMLAAMIALT